MVPLSTQTSATSPTVEISPHLAEHLLLVLGAAGFGVRGGSDISRSHSAGLTTPANSPTSLPPMARSVISTQTPRCDRCLMVPRWCICAGFQAVACPFAVDVLMHERERFRPTSTGRLIKRVVPESRQHLFEPGKDLPRDAIVRSDHTTWILHPRGEPVPTDIDPGKLQVLLLDGSWPEAARMAPAVSTWGRLVKLPEAGPSRYWLRDQSSAGHYSTMESLLLLLSAMGFAQEEARLRLQFELHVYAVLRTRGGTAVAKKFLATSPLTSAFPDLIEQLHQRRPLT